MLKEIPFKAYDPIGYTAHCSYRCCNCHFYWGTHYIDGYIRPEEHSIKCPSCGYPRTTEESKPSIEPDGEAQRINEPEIISDQQATAAQINQQLFASN